MRRQIIVSAARRCAIGFTAASLALGSSALNTASVTTVANANTTIDRVDAALSCGQRAAQHVRRHPEPLRVDDRELVRGQREPRGFAQPYSRRGLRGRDGGADAAQILQQAGVAILAQANARRKACWRCCSKRS